MSLAKNGVVLAFCNFAIFCDGWATVNSSRVIHMIIIMMMLIIIIIVNYYIIINLLLI